MTSTLNPPDGPGVDNTKAMGRLHGQNRWRILGTSSARYAKVLSLIFAVAAGVALILLVAAQFSLWQANPVDSPALEALRKQAASTNVESPASFQAREWDRLTRQAYFGGQAFIHRATWLFFIFSALALGCWRWAKSMAPVGPAVPAATGGVESAEDRRSSRAAMIGLAVALVAIAVALGLWGRHESHGSPGKVSNVPQGGTGTAGNETPSTNQGDAAGGATGTAIPAGGAKPAPWVTPDPVIYQNQWPSFRGPWGRGVSEKANPPKDWDGEKKVNLAWAVKPDLAGQGSPCVWGNSIYLCGTRGGMGEVLALRRSDGAVAWRKSVAPKGPPAKVSSDTGGAPSTPSTDGRTLAVAFPNGDVAAFDLDGNALWVRNLGPSANAYGYASSPLVYGHVYVQYDVDAGGMVLALDAATGADVWRSPRKAEASWASPVLVPRAKGLLLVTAAAPGIWGHDPESGVQVFHLAGLSGEVAPSPAWDGGVILAAQEYSALLACDAGGAKRWSVDGDLPNTASPVARGGVAFLVSAHGAVTAVSSGDGKTLATRELPGEYYSSPVVYAGRVVFLSRTGQGKTLSATAPFGDLADHKLGEGVNSTPAAVGGDLLIRGDKTLFCFRQGAGR